MDTPPPSVSALSRLYYELSLLGAPAVGDPDAHAPLSHHAADCTRLALAWCRFDPRLFEILVHYFLHHWQDLNPCALRKAYPSLETPQVLGVIGEFVSTHSDDPECRAYFAYLAMGLDPVSYQLFFPTLYPPGSPLALREASESLREYKKWGFLSRERPLIDRETRATAGTPPPETRRQILNRLLAARGKISIGDYLTALNHAISRQQAYLDLEAAPNLTPVGKGRGSRWEVRV